MEEETTKTFFEGMNSKVAFYFGLALGIGGMCLIGLIIILVGIWGGVSPKITSSGNSPEVAVQQPNQPEKPPTQVKITLTKDDHVQGAKNAPVTMVVYSDFQCPYCSRFHPVVKQIMEAYPKQVKVVFRQFPLSQLHPEAQKAAEASECASEQGKFWQYADKLFENQTQLGPDLYTKLAKDLSLDEAKFSSCLSSGKYTQKVQNSIIEGSKLGVEGTPGNFINGYALPGAVPFDQLKSIIDSQLNS